MVAIVDRGRLRLENAKKREKRHWSQRSGVDGQGLRHPPNRHQQSYRGDAHGLGRKPFRRRQKNEDKENDEPEY